MVQLGSFARTGLAGTARRVTLGVRRWSPWGPARSLLPSCYWRDVPKWGWLAEPRRFRGHDAMAFPEQPTDLNSCVRTEDYIVSFPTGSDICSS